jgi:hypothetical protein
MAMATAISDPVFMTIHHFGDILQNSVVCAVLFANHAASKVDKFLHDHVCDCHG